MANLLLKGYGDEAAFIAARRTDALQDQGDTGGFTDWLRVTKAIEQIRKKSRGDGETVN